MADVFELPGDASFHSSQNHHDSATPTEKKGRNFSILRRQSSEDGLVPTRSTSFGRKLIRRTSSKDQPRPDERPPRLPSMILQSPTQGAFPAIDTIEPSARTYSQAPNYSSPTAYSKRRMDPSNRITSFPQSSPPPPPPTYNNTASNDNLSRAESMANRGRYSYSSNAAAHPGSSPRKMRRRKDPTPFNILVAGTKGCGKTALIDFLRTSLSKPVKRRMNIQSSPSPAPAPQTEQHNGPFISHYLETELDGERVGLTLYDAKGFERHLVDLQLREITSFLENKFQETFDEEQKVMRSAGARDTHVHCILLVLDPSRLDSNIAVGKSSTNGYDRDGAYTTKPRVVGGLDEGLDIGVIRALEGRTTIIPIISKADTITTAHMAHLKHTVSASFKQIKFDPLEALDIDANEEGDDDGDESEYSEEEENTPPTQQTTPQSIAKRGRGTATSKPLPPAPSTPPMHNEIRFSAMSLDADLPILPLSVIAPDEYEPGVIGRRFAWGVADPYNEEHCDFVRLKDTVFGEWRDELREVSRERWYEGWRTTRLKKRSLAPSVPAASGSTTIPSTYIPFRKSMSPPAVPQTTTLSPSGGQRAVSSAAAYGNLAGRPAPSVPQSSQRALSVNQIGVAISEPNQAAHYAVGTGRV